MLTEEQKRERVGRMTSSVVAAALGLNPDATPIDAWLSIRGEREFEGNEFTERGDLLEPLVLDYGARSIGAAGWRKPRFVAHDNGWSGDSCDAVYVDEWGFVLALGEAKTVGLHGSGEWGDYGTNQVPAKVLIQAHWHLIHHPEQDYCVVPVLVGGYEFRFGSYRVDRHPERETALMRRAEQWHRTYVLGNRQPPVSEGDTDYLLGLFPVASEAMLQPGPEVDAVVMDVLIAQQVKKEAEEAYELSRNRLREMLGAHAGIKSDTYSVSYRNNAPSAIVDWEGLARKLGATPESIAEHTRSRPGPRVLRVVERKHARKSSVA